MQHIHLGLSMKRLLILVFLLFCSPAWATTYTVCGSGCDYTTIQDAVNAATTPGDTVQVQADSVGGTKTYAERVTTVAAGSEGNYITIKSRAGDTVIVNHATNGGFTISHAYIKVDGFTITGASSTAGFILVNQGAVNRGDYAIISNNTIYDGLTTGTGWTDGKCTGSACYRGAAGIYIQDTTMTNRIATAVTITGNTLYQLRYVYMFIYGTNHTITNNTIYGYNNALALQMNDYDAFMVFGTGHLIKNNTVYNLDGSCLDNCSNCGGGGAGTCGTNHTDFIQSYGDCGSAACQSNQNIVIDGNYVHDLKGTQIGQVTADGYDSAIKNFTFRNNIFSKIGLRFAAYADGIKFYNNVFYKVEDVSMGGNAQDPVQFNNGGASGIGTNGEVYNNIFIGCARTDDSTETANRGWYSVESGASATGNYNYVAKLDYSAKTGFSETNGVSGGDPKLANVSAGTAAGFALTATSTVLIDQGSAIAGWSSPTDYSGTSRPQGTAWDIGAYEYYGTAVRKLNNVTGVRVTLH